jgi:Mn-dependent DtxR family transcriptional regulator
VSTPESPGRRGRPRTSEAIERDEAIYQVLLQSGPYTRNEVAERMSLAKSLTYLALKRLQKAGRVKRCLTENGESVWSVEVDSPCP